MKKPVDPATLRQRKPGEVIAAALQLPPRPGSIPAPEEGVHHSVPFEDYCRWHAVNQTSLRRINDDCPAAFIDAWSHPEEDEDSNSKRFGRGLHALVLEPTRFAKDVVQESPPINKSTQKPYTPSSDKFQEWKAEWEKQGKVVLSPEEKMQLVAMNTRLQMHPRAKTLLGMPGHNEVSVVWRCPRTGILCKARFDRLIPDICMVDLKSTQSAHPDKFRASLVNYGYAFQDNFYKRGAAAHRLPSVMKFIPVCSSAPYLCTVVTVGPDTQVAARNLVDSALAKLAACILANEWPSYGPHENQDHEIQLEAPEYWFKRFNDGDEPV